MTNIEIHHRCADFDSYRAATVKSLFNVESGANFDLTVDLPLHERDWQIGVIVGPSGSGKTSIGKKLGKPYAPKWAKNNLKKHKKPHKKVRFFGVKVNANNLISRYQS